MMRFMTVLVVLILIFSATVLMAQNDDRPVLGQVPETRRDLRHRNVQTAVDGADRDFPRLAHVEQTA